MIIAALALLLPTAIVWWGLRDGEGGGRSPTAAALFEIGCAAVLATGLTSYLWFLWFQLVGVPGWTYRAVEIAALLATARYLRRWKTDAVVDRRAGRPTAADPQIGGVSVRRWTIAVLLLLGATWLISVVCYAAVHPHGSWDAAAMWSLKARYLAAGTERWHELIRNSAMCMIHGDYPLLVPVTIARLWGLSGATDPAIGALVSVWFAAATLALCSGFVGWLRGGNQALLAAATLLGTSFFIDQSSVQYADIPLAACMVACATALARYEESGRTATRWLVVAGAAAALAAWAKNEGLLFVAAIVAVRTLAVLREGNVRGALRREMPLLAGLLPGLLVIASFKLGVPSENDLVAGQGLSATLARAASPSRYFTIVIALIVHAERMLKPLLFVLPVYYYLMGPSDGAEGRRATRWLLVIYGVMFVGYFAVYVTTPQPLAWHLQTSLRRLLLQLWPGFLVAMFLRVASPDERL